MLIRVRFWSSPGIRIRYRASGHKGVTRKFPHTPGIDAQVLMVDPAGSSFREGTEVIVTGYDLELLICRGFMNSFAPGSVDNSQTGTITTCAIL